MSRFFFGVQFSCDFKHAGKPFTANDPCLVRVVAENDKQARQLGEGAMDARFPNIKRRFKKVIPTGFRVGG